MLDDLVDKVLQSLFGNVIKHSFSSTCSWMYDVRKKTFL